MKYEVIVCGSFDTFKRMVEKETRKIDYRGHSTKGWFYIVVE